MSKLYGLIFDVDGVVADTEAANAAVSIRVFADLFDVTGVQRADFEAGLGRGAEEYVKAAARVHSLELTDPQIAQAARLRQEYFLKLLAEQPLPAYPGVLELIDAAEVHPDFRLAIATSSTREKSQAVLQSACVPYQRMIYITGSEVTNKKPHPELFQLAARQLELPPRRCLVIEDAPNGIAAAHAAGCPCIAVTNTTVSENLTPAELIVTSLAHITLDTVAQLIDSK